MVCVASVEVGIRVPGMAGAYFPGICTSLPGVCTSRGHGCTPEAAATVVADALPTLFALGCLVVFTTLLVVCRGRASGGGKRSRSDADIGGGKSKSFRFDPERRGQLSVRVHSAKGLKAADWNFKSDPYVVVTFGDQTAKTFVVNKTLNPTWVTAEQSGVLRLRFCAIAACRPRF